MSRNRQPMPRVMLSVPRPDSAANKLRHLIEQQHQIAEPRRLRLPGNIASRDSSDTQSANCRPTTDRALAMPCSAATSSVCANEPAVCRRTARRSLLVANASTICRIDSTRSVRASKAQHRKALPPIRTIPRCPAGSKSLVSRTTQLRKCRTIASARSACRPSQYKLSAVRLVRSAVLRRSSNNWARTASAASPARPARRTAPKHLCCFALPPSIRQSSVGTFEHPRQSAGHDLIAVDAPPRRMCAALIATVECCGRSKPARSIVRQAVARCSVPAGGEFARSIAAVDRRVNSPPDNRRRGPALESVPHDQVDPDVRFHIAAAIRASPHHQVGTDGHCQFLRPSAVGKPPAKMPPAPALPKSPNQSRWQRPLRRRETIESSRRCRTENWARVPTDRNRRSGIRRRMTSTGSNPPSVFK